MALTKRLSKNNIRSSLAGAISAVATTMTVQSGVGATLPSPNNAIGEYFDFTIQDQATGLRVEIVAVTAVVGDVLTIVRGQQSTTGQAWNAGDTCFLAVTAGAYDSWVQPSQVQSGQYVYAEAAGTTTAYTASLTPAIAALTEGMIVTIDTTAVGTNTTSAPTLNLNGIGAYTITLQNDVALRAGDLPRYAQFTWNATGTKWTLLNPLLSNNLQRLLTSLDYPTISTATNKATVTPSTDAAGGKVTLTAGTVIELGKANGTNGIMMVDATTAFISPSLAVSSTYYLRCMYVGDVLTFYVQKGTDTDTIPAGLIGTVNGTSGGGFDSTVLDMLIAKIVTGTAGTTPTVTALANAKKLVTVLSFAAKGGVTDSTAALTWARTPTVFLSTVYGCGSASAYLDADAWLLFVSITRSVCTVNTAYYQWTTISTQFGNSSATTITLQG